MRKNNSNGARLDAHEDDINMLKRQSEKSKEQYDAHIEYHIKEDLQTMRFVGSDKPMYSYADIAQNHDVSTSKVQAVAEKNGLTRRKSNFSA